MKKILAWAKRRLSERSTYVGLATIAGVVGLPGVAGAIGAAGQIAAIVVGSGLIATPTSDDAEPVA